MEGLNSGNTTVVMEWTPSCNGGRRLRRSTDDLEVAAEVTVQLPRPTCVWMSKVAVQLVVGRDHSATAVRMRQTVLSRAPERSLEGRRADGEMRRSRSAALNPVHPR